jgi:hypothetical protein
LKQGKQILIMRNWSEKCYQALQSKRKFCYKSSKNIVQSQWSPTAKT